MTTSTSKRLSVLTCVVVSLLMATVVGCRRVRLDIFGPDQATRMRLRAFGERSIVPYEYPVSLSPNRKSLLVKLRTLTAFALETRDRRGTVQSRVVSTFNPWELTWSPDGFRIAYLVERPEAVGSYELRIWEPETGRPSVAAATPPTNNASYPVRWSPSGKALGYVVSSKERSDLYVVSVTDESSRSELIARDVDPHAGFAWSGGGDEVVFRHTGPVGLSIWHGSNGIETDFDFDGQDSADIKDLNWAPSKETVLASARNQGDEFFNSISISLHTGVRRCAAVVGDEAQAQWEVPEKQYVYVLHRGGLDQLLRRQGCDVPIAMGHPTADVLRLQNDATSRSSDAIVIDAGPSGPPMIQEAPARSGGEDFGAQPAFAVEQVSVHGISGEVPMWHLYPAQRDSRKAVVLVHGGPHLEERAIWDPMSRAFLDAGYQVFTPNYSGSTGYGATLEFQGDADTQAQDLLDSLAYLRDDQKIPGGKIVIIASSYGASVVMRALNIKPDLASTIVFAPMLPRSMQIGLRGDVAARVLIFQGGRDPLTSPENAREAIGRLFAARAQGRKVYYREFADEAHGFSRIETQQEIFGSVLCAVDDQCWNNVSLNANQG